MANDVSNGTASAKNKITVVLGAQWGDEGKGKLVDLVAKDFDVVARCQVRVARGCYTSLLASELLKEPKCDS